MANRIVHTSKMAWILDPKEPMAGLVADGGIIVASVSPGCWGAMITPDYASGHEVTHPIAVEGAKSVTASVSRLKRSMFCPLRLPQGQIALLRGISLVTLSLPNGVLVAA